MFSPEQMVSGTGGAANNYARGYYTIGREIKEDALDAIRQEAEKADRLLQVRRARTYITYARTYENTSIEQQEN